MVNNSRDESTTWGVCWKEMNSCLGEKKGHLSLLSEFTLETRPESNTPAGIPESTEKSLK
jgi:hypothetical protein